MTEIPNAVSIPESKESVSSGTVAIFELHRVVSAIGASPYFKLIVLCLIGVVEVLLLGVLVDTGTLSRQNVWWASWIEHSPQILQVVISACVAWLVLGWNAVNSKIQNSGSYNSKLWFGSVVGHSTCYIAFACLSQKIFAFNESTPSAFWLLAWVIAGAATVVALATCVLPLKVLKSLVVQSRLAILGGSLTGLAAWFVGDFVNRAWRPLAGGTFTLVHVLLDFVYDDVLIDRSQLILGTSRFSVRIAPACSGYEGLGLIGVFLLVFTWVFRDRLRFPQTLLLFPIGFALVWLMNAVRIAVLVAIGTSWSSKVAAGGFHSQAGWIVFNIVALCLVVVSTRLKFFAKIASKDTARAAIEINETASYLAPFLAAIAIGMIADTFNVPATVSVGLRVIGSLCVLFLLKRGLGNLNWSFSWSAIPVGAAVYVVWILLLPTDNSVEGPAKFDSSFASGLLLASFAIRLLGYVLMTPIIEELAFRGFLMRRVVSPDFQRAPLKPLPWAGILISAILFGMFHGMNWISGIFAGLLYAIAFARTGRLGDSIAAHATTNGMLATHSILTGNWSVWT